VFFQQRVVFPLVPFLPTVRTFANADDEPGVGVGRAARSSDEVVNLEDELAVISEAAALVARIVAEYTAAVTNDDDVSHEALYLVLKFRCVRNTFNAEPRLGLEWSIPL
jgi:hypothetical protein